MTNPVTYDLVLGATESVLVTELAAVYELSMAGPPGLVGPPGPVVAPTEYDLTTVSNWTQAHSLPYLPEVRVVDTANRQVFVEVNYPDSTHINISFPTPFTGKVLVS